MQRATKQISTLCLLGALAAPLSHAYAQTSPDPAATTQPAQAPAIEDRSQGLPVKQMIAEALASAKGEAAKQRLSQIDANYAAAGYAPIWVGEGTINANARQMVDALNLAFEDGLDPADYGANGLLAKMAASDPAALAAFEVELSIAAVAFSQHMNAGRVNPRDINRELLKFPKVVATDTVLSSLRKTKQVKAYLRLLAPHTARYERLRQALAAYRRIEKQGGFSVVADGPAIKPGATDDRVPAIRKRMQEAGTLPADVQFTGETTKYDEALAKAVAGFQELHGLEALGTIGKQTIAAMNVPISRRIFEMELNLERNRWMQNDFGPYHIFANLADQVVKVVRNEDTVRAEVIQVGQPYHQTPEFSDVMEYVEFNPYWGVPPSIAVNEYLPKLRSNPGVLAAQNISVFSGGKQVSAGSVNWSQYGRGNFPFTLRQEPGKGNALGRVKFMFPNEFNVYMHDTPSKAKFEESSRYFSHGCLRLKDPLTMAEVLLGPEGWDRAKIDAVVAGGKNTVVKLKTPIPVHIVYLTAFVNKNGTVNFREDVYGRDKLLADALAKLRGK
jgi:murein L,D-transpeptidase YcbB/YkuD